MNNGSFIRIRLKGYKYTEWAVYTWYVNISQRVMYPAESPLLMFCMKIMGIVMISIQEKL